MQVWTDLKPEMPSSKTQNDAGEPIIDRNGNKNEWIIGDAKFKQKYEADPEHPGVFRPTGGKQKFVKTSENLVISQWGDEMRMPKGSYINITNPEDMYAINPRDFEDTYRALPKDESENSENQAKRLPPRSQNPKEAHIPRDYLYSITKYQKCQALTESASYATLKPQ